MSNNKVLSRPHVAKSQGRHAFDRSSIRNYTQSAGMIVPVFFEPCLAGTKGKINRQVFTRASKVVAPAFPAVKMEVDFFKVPIRYLWSKWNDWKLNINDLNSSALVAMNTAGVGTSTMAFSVPRFNFGDHFAGDFLGWNNTYRQSETNTMRAERLNDAFRILQPIYGLNPTSVGGGSAANMKSLFGLAAYQKVYYDHFRNTAYEGNNPYAYNLDWLQNETTENLLQISDANHYYALENMLTLRYVNYRNDYYHNIYPALNYVSSTPNGMNWSLPSSVSQIHGRTPGVDGSNGQVLIGGGIYIGATGVYTPGSISSVQNIRAAFALDKLLRASAYAPKHVKDQLLARYGVNVGDKVSFESERIGSFDHDIIFGEVTNTANVGGTSLGEVGGKGVGASNFEKDLDFYCEEDSIILGVSYVIPRAIYDCVEDEWHNNLIREDFYQPEFENLGLRPLINPATPTLGYIMGYAPPYQRLKLGKDLNMSEFCSSTISYEDNGTSVVGSSRSGSLAAYTIHVNNYQNYSSNGVSYQYFKVLPSHLNDIFVQGYKQDGNPYYDHFFSHLQIKFNVVQGMSYHGQPSL